ncbi:hypothetical protein D4R20_00090 [bacterium]|nr:MAG: hypothetical protein D4R20_00090 [bacterium]
MIDKKDEMLIDLLRRSQNYTFENGKHRELSAWAIAVFYISILGITFNYFNTLVLKATQESIYLGILLLIFIIVIILLFCIVVFGFIHTQYGMISSVMATSLAINQILFEISCGQKKDGEFNEKKWKIKDDNGLPEFVQERLDEMSKKFHHRKDINPSVIFCWFFKALRKGETTNKRIDLIESSLYSLILIPTISIICLLTIKYFYLVILCFCHCH